jgi:streptogramin lyase
MSTSKRLVTAVVAIMLTAPLLSLSGRPGAAEPAPSTRRVTAPAAAAVPGAQFTVTRFSGLGDNASGLIAGPDGNLWYALSGGDEVVKLTPTGATTTYSLPYGSAPRSIAVASDGTLWIAGAAAVTQMDTTGTVAATYPLATDQHANHIVAGPDGALWVAAATFDTSWHSPMILRVALDGTTTPFVAVGTSIITGMTVGGDGNIYYATVLASGATDIVRMTTGGAHTDLPSPSDVRDMTKGPDGQVWTVGSSLTDQRIQRISPTGTVTTVAQVRYTNVTSLTSGPDGNLWFGGESSPLLGRITTAGTVTTWTTGPLATAQIVDIATGPDHRIWFLDDGSPTSGIDRINEPAGFVETPRAVGGQYFVGSGDFNGDGITDLLFYTPGTGSDGVWFMHADGTFTPRSIVVNGNYSWVEIGDFNGDGRDDILWYAPGATPDPIWFGAANDTFSGRFLQINGSFIPALGYFNNDNYLDILWYAPGTAPDAIWYGHSDGTFSGKQLTITTSFDAIFGSDINGDGLTDLIFWRQSSSSHPMWVATANGTFRGATINGPGPGSAPIVGYYDNDDKTDIVWYGPGAARDAVAYAARGLNTLTPLSIGGNYVPLQGNWDGNAAGRWGILWWNIDTGVLGAWTSTGTGFTGTTLLNEPLGYDTHWPVYGTFDTDNADDLFWYGVGTASDLFARGIDTDAPAGHASAPVPRSRAGRRLPPLGRPPLR